jgi:hypothetical protein
MMWSNSLLNTKKIPAKTLTLLTSTGDILKILAHWFVVAGAQSLESRIQKTV